VDLEQLVNIKVEEKELKVRLKVKAVVVSRSAFVSAYFFFRKEKYLTFFERFSLFKDF